MPQYDQRYTAGTFLIYLDRYDDGIPCGQIFHPQTEECLHFRGLTQLLLSMEQTMDLENLPQSFQSVRTFFPFVGTFSNNADAQPRVGKLATFALQILFRRNASWQGSISWLEGKQRQSFRSVLELVHLMNSAMEAKRLTLPETAPVERLREA
ncbi:MAG: hypothetical protein E7449_07160 [Ruminococcaceae bacterium]|nr:hypothetical protein [Oscillospiraceae bacterium]